MKKTLYIVPFVILILLSNCKYFRKKDIVEPIDTLKVDTIQYDTLPYLGEGVYWLEEVEDKFLIVVGSFETLEFAKIHAKKYGRLGLTTKIILKPDGYYMVSAKSYKTYDGAHEELPDFRKRIAKKAWVYINYRVLSDMDQASLTNY